MSIFDSVDTSTSSSSSDSTALSSLANGFCKERKEAINARKRSGLDRVWQIAREQYRGIDAENRNQGYLGSKGMQPANNTGNGPLVSMGASSTSRSTVFVNITRPYTDAGTARIADIYLPTGKMPWKLKTTPVSDLELLKGILASQPAAQEILPFFPELAQRLQMDPESQQQAMEGAETLIKDWHAETGWLGELRLLIKEMGQTGTGVLKNPIARRKKLSSDIQAFYDILVLQVPEAARELELQLLYTPGSECIKVENCFPDGNCGSDIQNGAYFFELVPNNSRRKLEDLLEDQTYFGAQIQACLDEGAQSTDGIEEKSRDKKRPFDLWVRTGKIKLEGLVDEADLDEDSEPFLFGTAIMCNDRVIKLAEPLLDIERFPYDIVKWREREDSWAGIGIPEDMETPQRGLNASVRAMQDNLAYSVGPQLLVLDGLIEPADGDWQMHAYKRWNAKVDGITTKIEDVKKALSLIEFPNYTDELLPVINFWLKMAEDTTGLPLLLQGQSSSDAVGVSQQLQNNATTNLRLIIKALDDDIVVPNVTASYEWSQAYGPASVKGDATVEALGSSVLVIKELQQQALLQIGDRVLQPVYGISPSKWMAAFLEGHQLDAEQLAMTDEEREQLQQAEQQPDPKVEVAQIEAEVDRYVADLRAEMDEMKLQLEAQVKGASLEQAAEVVDTQAATQIAVQDMKQAGDKEKEAMRVTGQEGGNGQPPTPKALAPSSEPSIDDALSTLGFVQ